MIASETVAGMAKAKLALRASFIDVPLVLAFCAVESGDWKHPRGDYDENAFRADRNGGSFGLMQIDLQTACDRGYGGKPAGLYDPSANIEYGMRQIRWIGDFLKRHGLFSIANVAAAYNEGVGNVLKGRADPEYAGKLEHALSLLAT